jgi:hypothetical protein
VSLLLHLFRAGQPKLYASVGVDLVVNAMMAGAETAQHPAVRRIDNGITTQGGYISLPQVDALLNRRQIPYIRNPPACSLFFQIRILNLHKFFAHGPWHTKVKK